jgi:hypothetical protein
VAEHLSHIGKKSRATQEEISKIFKIPLSAKMREQNDGGLYLANLRAK